MIPRAVGLSLVLFVTMATAANAASLIVLNYHDVTPDPAGDRYAVSRSSFVAQMDFLQQNQYRPISLSTLEQIVTNNAPLPERSVLLTFDDGLKSYHDFVAPLLAIYDFPSVVSLVSAWHDGINVPAEYQDKLMTWSDVRALARYPQVAIISHTHNLHYGIRSNPQNNLRGAATTRQYFPKTDVYETEVQFRERIRNDIAASLSRLSDEIGIEPRAIAWPYGEYDQAVYDEARSLNISLQFVLADGNLSKLSSGVLGRMLIVDQPAIAEFAKLLEPRAPISKRFADVRLDDFVGKSADEQEQLLSELLNSLEPWKLNSVIVTPVTKDGTSAFFPTPSMTLASNILDRVIHQIRTRLNVRFIVLRIPSRIVVRDRNGFLADLARLNRFDGVAFEPGVSREFQTDARNVLPSYRVNVKFGIFDDLRRSADYDFHVISATALSRIKDVDANRIWVMLSNPAMPGAAQNLGPVGVREYVNYGFPFDSISKARSSRQPSDSAVRKGG